MVGFYSLSDMIEIEKMQRQMYYETISYIFLHKINNRPRKKLNKMLDKAN